MVALHSRCTRALIFFLWTFLLDDFFFVDIVAHLAHAKTHFGALPQEGAGAGAGAGAGGEGGGGGAGGAGLSSVIQRASSCMQVNERGSSSSKQVKEALGRKACVANVLLIWC